MTTPEPKVTITRTGRCTWYVTAIVQSGSALGFPLYSAEDAVCGPATRRMAERKGQRMLRRLIRTETWRRNPIVIGGDRP